MFGILYQIGLALVVVLLVLVGMWLFVPVLSGLPWRPTQLARARRALALAGLRRGETLYDLGAGDGRVLLLAAREFGARAVGVEISPLHCLAARLSARWRGLSPQVAVRCADFNRVDLSGADVVYLYMTAGPAERLRPHLERQLRPGARVVAVSFAFAGWKPAAYDPESLVFVYTMPPVPGGLEAFLADRWPDGAEAR